MENRIEIEVVGVHAEGEIGRVLMGGAPAIPGDTLLERMNYLNHVDNTIVRFALFEPRGSANMTVNLLMTPVDKRADVAFIPLQPDGAHAISGSNCICVATAVLETGRVAMAGQETVLSIETPAGLVKAIAQCRDGKCESVAVQMTTSFVEELDVKLSVPGIGDIIVDVAYGGCYFVLVDAAQLKVPLRREYARNLVDLASSIKKAATHQIQLQARSDIAVRRIEYVMFVGESGGRLINCNIIHPGRIDRSPCGTGSGARLAVMLSRGQCAVNEKVVFHSLVDGKFDCRILTSGSAGITHEIAGRAWVYSNERYWAHQSDPYQTGYALSDIWGPDIDA
ncbi:proline racemase family protein [Caballeronia sp. DA-9]|uniref:proline racemase family protein n=1 Tax=Caballeronia sp. DA-9 TaxID=3436237 RepID=UPI003F667B47